MTQSVAAIENNYLVLDAVKTIHESSIFGGVHRVITRVRDEDHR